MPDCIFYVCVIISVVFFSFKTGGSVTGTLADEEFCLFYSHYSDIQQCLILILGFQL